MRKLKHPNVCGYRGVCIARAHLSLVYDFIENGTLGDALRNGRRRIGTDLNSSRWPASRDSCSIPDGFLNSSTNRNNNSNMVTDGNVAASGFRATGPFSGRSGQASISSDTRGATGSETKAVKDAARFLPLRSTGEPPPPRQLGTVDLLCIAEDVVDGMHYLHEVKWADHVFCCVPLYRYTAPQFLASLF